MSVPVDYPEDFQRAVKSLLTFEGGYVNDPTDPGGETKYGISKAAYPDLNIAALTVDEAIDIYYRDFWMKYGIDKLPSALADKMLNLVANMGVGGVRCLQRACWACGHAMPDDGIVGPLTIDVATALIGASADALMAALKSEAAGYYRVLIALNWRLQKYQDGWMRRAYA